MKILQLMNSLGNGGAEKLVVELSNELSKDHKVVLVTFRKNESWMIPPGNIAKMVRNISLNIGSKKSISNWVASFLLIHRERPDIVHVHSSLVMLYLYLMPLFYPKTRFIHTIHNTLTIPYQKAFNLFTAIPLIRRRWLNICISNRIFDIYSRVYPLMKFQHVDNGIAELTKTNDFRLIQREVKELKKKCNEAPLLIAIGNYSDLKRFDLLVEAMKHFDQQGEPIQLILLGEDGTPKQTNFRTVLAKKGANSHLLGLKKNVADYLALSDALIISSSMEGMPLVILEAFSLGKPIIASPAGGVVDLVKEGINGFIAEDLSKDSLIKAIERFRHASIKELEQISQNNLAEFASKYSMALCAENYMRIFTS